MQRAAGVLATSANGKSRLSIVEPPLPTGAIAQAFFVGRRRTPTARLRRKPPFHSRAGAAVGPHQRSFSDLITASNSHFGAACQKWLPLGDTASVFFGESRLTRAGGAGP
jgi:hypothetical protein